MSYDEYDEALNKISQYLEYAGLEPDTSAKIETVTPESICKVFNILSTIVNKGHDMHHKEDATFEDQVHNAGSTLDLLHSLITVNLEGLRNYYNLYMRNNQN